jgi:glycosyltransferase involved in cell wall biosynthesis
LLRPKPAALPWKRRPFCLGISNQNHWKEVFVETEDMPLVSVLTPVHNGATYLAECIESVLAQSYSNWEYAIVNNRSTDHSLAIAQQYAERDPRIRVVTNCDFVGVMANHNLALKEIASASAYVKFVHADDWLYPECIARMVELAETHPSVGVVGSYGLWGTKVAWDGLPYPSEVVSGREVCRKVLFGMCRPGGFYVFGSPSSIMIRTDCIRKRERLFKEANLHGDMEACIDLLQHADFGFIHQVLTFSRRHRETVTSFADDYQSYFPAGIRVLQKYGRTFLSEEEYRTLAGDLWQRYYGYLAHAVLERRDRAFWSYHRQAILQLGHRLNLKRLALATFAIAVGYLNPLPLRPLIRALKTLTRSAGGRPAGTSQSLR